MKRIIMKIYPAQYSQKLSKTTSGTAILQSGLNQDVFVRSAGIVFKGRLDEVNPDEMEHLDDYITQCIEAEAEPESSKFSSDFDSFREFVRAFERVLDNYLEKFVGIIKGKEKDKLDETVNSCTKCVRFWDDFKNQKKHPETYLLLSNLSYRSTLKDYNLVHRIQGKLQFINRDEYYRLCKNKLGLDEFMENGQKNIDQRETQLFMGYLKDIRQAIVEDKAPDLKGVDLCIFLDALETMFTHYVAEYKKDKSPENFENLSKCKKFWEKLHNPDLCTEFVEFIPKIERYSEEYSREFHCLQDIRNRMHEIFYIESGY